MLRTSVHNKNPKVRTKLRTVSQQALTRIANREDLTALRAKSKKLPRNKLIWRVRCEHSGQLRALKEMLLKLLKSHLGKLMTSLRDSLLLNHKLPNGRLGERMISLQDSHPSNNQQGKSTEDTRTVCLTVWRKRSLHSLKSHLLLKKGPGRTHLRNRSLISIP